MADAESIFIFSDLHGDADAALSIAKAMDRRKPQRVAFAGDAYNPGRSHSAARLLEQLELTGNFTAVAGNCDRDPAEDGLKYTMFDDYALLNCGNHRLFLSHGDRWNLRRLPPSGLGDILVFGHTHMPFAQCFPENGLIAFNPGSCALPRGGWPPSYGWMADGKMTVCQLDDDETLLEINV